MKEKQNFPSEKENVKAENENSEKNHEKYTKNTQKSSQNTQKQSKSVSSKKNGTFLSRATNPDIFDIQSEKMKMNQIEVGEDLTEKVMDLSSKNTKDLNKKFTFKSRSIIAVCLVFIITLFAVGAVVLSGNLSATEAVTANVTNTRIVQAKLASLGYFDGEINGVYNSGTIEAIKNFQADKNLNVTGSLDSATTVALGVTDNAQANTDLYLLAKLIYSEARGEVYQGQVAVGAVVLNRVADAGFPNTLQGVIYQPWAFTALHDGQFSLEPNSTAYQAAQDAMNGWDPTYGCLYYYNPKTATSSWIFSRQIIVTIGNHVFCV